MGSLIDDWDVGSVDISVDNVFLVDHGDILDSQNVVDRRVQLSSANIRVKTHLDEEHFDSQIGISGSTV